MKRLFLFVIAMAMACAPAQSQSLTKLNVGMVSAIDMLAAATKNTRPKAVAEIPVCNALSSG